MVQRQVARVFKAVERERLAPRPPREPRVGPVVEGGDERTQSRRDQGGVHRIVELAAGQR
eukprot:scaffold15759_cov112-Isochrysis_galbana.AAC.3